MIGQSPADFWESSHIEVVNAIRGFGDFHNAGQKEEPMTRERMQEMMELYPD